MKRKPMLAPRNPYVVPAKHRHAGAHGKSVKAVRRADKMALNKQWDSSLVARQPAFTRYQGEFESPGSHHY